MPTPSSPGRPPFIVSTADVPEDDATGYPQSDERLSHGRAIGKLAGLLRIGLHVERIPPGRRTSYPHAEENEEEFAYVLEGEVDAWIDGHLHRLKKGDLAAFPAGTGISHTLINNCDVDALVMVGGEASKRESKILYPRNPERKPQLAWSQWWSDAPMRTLGSHDGRPGPRPDGAKPTASPLSSPDAWNLVADGYAEEAVKITGPFSERALALADVVDGADVLDVAAGSGATSLLLSSRAKSVTALDFSAELLRRFELNLEVAKISNVRVLLGDGQALPFEASHFDAAFSMFGLMFFPDRHKGFCELARVLRPGGIAVVGSWAPPEESTLMSTLSEAIKAIDPTTPADAGPPPAMPLSDPREFELEMRRAGFSEVVVERHTIGFDIPGADLYWETMSRSNVMLVLLRKRLGEEVWADRIQLTKARLAETLGSNGARLETTAFLGRGIARG